MLKTLIAPLLLAVTFFSAATSQPAYAADYDPFARDIKILSKWFEGEFDNSEQLWFENYDAAKVPENRRAERIHTTHVRLDMPETGDHVFYVEEYMDNDPDNMIRQRFVIFSSDTDENAIRMKQGFIKNGKRYYGVKKLDKIKFSDVTFLDECDVFWHRDGGQYKGSMKAKTCVFGDGDKRRYSVHDMTLSADKYWRTDSTYLVSDDSFYKGNQDGFPTRFRKANRFTCDVSFKPEDKEGLSFAEIREKSENVKGQSIHSEGGTFVVKRKYDGQEFEYLMREKEYPFYDERPEFIYFSMRAKGDPYSIAYLVADIDARRLGGQFGDYGFNCHRDGYDFQESLEILNSK